MLKKMRGWWKRHPWYPLVGAVAVLFLLAWIDARTKSSALTGYCPEDATLIVATRNFPAIYGQALQSGVAKQGGDEVRKLYTRVEQWGRLAAGIRPTPARWGIWLGQTAVAARGAEGWGLCLRPGMLLRAADVYRRVVHRAHPDADGIVAYDALFYAWRDGFLIASESRAYVAACLAAPEPDLEAFLSYDDLAIEWRKPPRGAVHVRIKNDIRVEGWIEGTITHRSTPLTTADVWPERPMVSVAVSKGSDLKQLFAWAWLPLEAVIVDAGSERLAALKDGAAFLSRQWGLDALPADWDKSVDECAVAVMDVDVQEVTPAPEIAAILRSALPAQGAYPLDELAVDGQMLPYEWKGHAGRLIPWLGEKLSPCLSSCERDWLFTTQEPTMARLAGRLREDAPVKADVALRADWKKLSERAEALVRRAAELELIPRVNVKDVESRVIPYVKMAACLGTLRIDGEGKGDRIAFEGVLAHPQEKTEEGASEHLR